MTAALARIAECRARLASSKPSLRCFGAGALYMVSRGIDKRVVNRWQIDNPLVSCAGRHLACTELELAGVPRRPKEES
jgi:hypothetical protein